MFFFTQCYNNQNEANNRYCSSLSPRHYQTNDSNNESSYKKNFVILLFHVFCQQATSTLIFHFTVRTYINKLIHTHSDPSRS